MADMERLINEFDKDMHQILEKEREIGLCSTRFRQMVEQYGGVETAHRLLKSSDLPPMFKDLRDKGRLDLAMEHYVALEKYQPLFSNDERAIADFRLHKDD